MRTDTFGQLIFSETDLMGLFYKNPNQILKNVLVDEEICFDNHLSLENIPDLIKYKHLDISVEEFDDKLQQEWFMPKEYKELDIAKWVLEQCSDDAELQRAGHELLMFQERNLFMLLKYLKFLVDIMRQHNIVWGVGRGSSVSSFVLYLIGVHKINSLYYDLPIDEFLHD